MQYPNIYMRSFLRIPYVESLNILSYTSNRNLSFPIFVILTSNQWVGNMGVLRKFTLLYLKNLIILLNCSNIYGIIILLNTFQFYCHIGPRYIDIFNFGFFLLQF